jgi:hypothetical protein
MKSVHLSLPLDEPHGSAVPMECHHPGHFLFDSEISECESDDEGVDVEMDNTGSEYSHQDMLRNITHMINFVNTKDDRYLKFMKNIVLL